MNINYNEIDEKMRPIIKELNKNGLTTRFCCEGHWNEEKLCYKNGYIYFNKPLKEMPMFNTYKPIPKGKTPSQVMNSYYYMTKDMRIIYWQGDRHKRVSFEEKTMAHDNFLEELKKWSEKQLTNL